jgi:hypothetical protein
MYSVVTSMNRAPTSVSRRASRQPRPNRAAIAASPVSLSGSTSGGRYFRKLSFGSVERSNAAAAGELRSRWALSIERSIDSRWYALPNLPTGLTSSIRL